jgi:N-ethylmaleimide reductase
LTNYPGISVKLSAGITRDEKADMGQGRYDALFQPITMGEMSLPNRIAMAPMTRYRADEDGLANDLHVTYYSQRASAGVIVAETSYIEETGRISSFLTGICRADQVVAWKRVTDAVHAKGGRIVLQLMHGGRFSHPDLQPDGGTPMGVSAIAIEPPEIVRMKKGDVPTGTPREMTLAEIHRLIDAYAHAASNARKAGFDGVELHAGNGYLPSQFINSNANKRRDAYGGSIANRARFALEAMEAIIGAVGNTFAGVKVSPWIRLHGVFDDTPEETHAYVARALSGLKPAYMHAQLQFDYLPIMPEPFDPLALVRRNFDGVLMASGGFSRERALEAVTGGELDIVAFGRRFAANPDLPERIRLDAVESPVDRDTITARGPDPRGFIDYPAMKMP